jgi:hypothetical protein
MHNHGVQCHRSTPLNKAPQRGVPCGHDVFNAHPGKPRDFELLGNSWQIRQKSRTPGSEQSGQVLGTTCAHFLELVFPAAGTVGSGAGFGRGGRRPALRFAGQIVSKRCARTLQCFVTSRLGKLMRFGGVGSLRYSMEALCGDPRRPKCAKA